MAPRRSARSWPNSAPRCRLAAIWRRPRQPPRPRTRPRTQRRRRSHSGSGSRAVRRSSRSSAPTSRRWTTATRDAMAAHWREDGVEDIVPVGVVRGRDELRDYFASLFAAMPDARTTVTRLVAGEQNCAVEWRLEATLERRAVHGHRAQRQAHRDPRVRPVRARGRRAREQHRLLRRRRPRPPDRHAAGGRLGRRPRDEGRVQRGDEAAPRRRGAQEADPDGGPRRARRRPRVVDHRLGVRHQGLRRLPAHRRPRGGRRRIPDREALPRPAARPRGRGARGAGRRL